MRDGAIGSFSVSENLMLLAHGESRFSRRGVLRTNAIRAHGESLVEEYAVKTPDLSTATSSLSGGNIQKLILARELDGEPPVLLAAQPTRGVDIGAAGVHTRAPSRSAGAGNGHPGHIRGPRRGDGPLRRGGRDVRGSGRGRGAPRRLHRRGTRAADGRRGGRLSGRGRGERTRSNRLSTGHRGTPTIEARRLRDRAPRRVEPQTEGRAHEAVGLPAGCEIPRPVDPAIHRRERHVPRVEPRRRDAGAAEQGSGLLARSGALLGGGRPDPHGHGVHVDGRALHPRRRCRPPQRAPRRRGAMVQEQRGEDHGAGDPPAHRRHRQRGGGQGHR